MTKQMIELTNIHKHYSDQIILDNVSFHLNSGEIVGLIGPSGSGKSTIINIALGMIKADEGHATVMAELMPNRKVLADLGYMAQSDALYETLSARENLNFFADMKGISRGNRQAEVTRVAKVVNLIPYLDRMVSQFSGGMKRRLSLAIALLGDPQILILDEPTVGIDPALRRQIWSELQSMRDKGHAILVTTHVMDEAELTDRVALLLDGRLIANDAPQHLETQYQVNSIEEVFLKVEETN
ncbi:ABC transporter ATP-binding protein [Weissella diestrammenae]|uniref:ABC transporter ATP-binding protein n=1 Tax=Weissella diestrammenae TaxID=1162633 RepID=A0A7G9T5A0_9LACO|nr:ABC transporter ATP-binding protein [Weissella diestrammenae]MCM0583132.1 ABC transporter ATP-binding protein [Weissella diestrammenae]QNN75275.1 ABC transporter ATP-binding protein [Weissella diestrammenae]